MVLWLGTAIEKGQLASCRPGCKLTAEIWSRGLPEEPRMLGETAKSAPALLAGKQGQGEGRHGGKATEATPFRRNDAVLQGRTNAKPG